MDDQQQIPLGFGFALAMNQDAMAKYEKMTEAEKEMTLARTKKVASKEEMEHIVNSLANGDESEFGNLLNNSVVE